MTNLALKLGLVSGLAGALTLHGDERQARPSAPREYPVAITAMSPDAPAFAAEIMRLAAAADAIDVLWHDYKSQCGVRVARQYDFGREWFSIWDGAAEATIHAPRCSDVPRRLKQEGDIVRRDLLRARATARFLGHGTEIGTLRWHALQWP
jgi:hypothetical protein